MRTGRGAGRLCLSTSVGGESERAPLHERRIVEWLERASHAWEGGGAELGWAGRGTKDHGS